MLARRARGVRRSPLRAKLDAGRARLGPHRCRAPRPVPAAPAASTPTRAATARRSSSTSPTGPGRRRSRCRGTAAVNTGDPGIGLPAQARGRLDLVSVGGTVRCGGLRLHDEGGQGVRRRRGRRAVGQGEACREREGPRHGVVPGCGDCTAGGSREAAGGRGPGRRRRRGGRQVGRGEGRAQTPGPQPWLSHRARRRTGRVGVLRCSSVRCRRRALTVPTARRARSRSSRRVDGWRGGAPAIELPGVAVAQTPRAPRRCSTGSPCPPALGQL